MICELQRYAQRGERLIQQEKSYHEQIEKFYKKALKSYEVFQLGDTPDFLSDNVAQKLPVVMTQKTLNKCIRSPKGSRSAHQLGREIVERIPDILSKPALLVRGEDKNRIALISPETDFKGDPILIALKLTSRVQNKEVNEIASVYGRENCKMYLGLQEDVTIVDIKRAKQLSRLLGLQLPTTWKVLDYKKNIPQKTAHVKQENAKNNNLRSQSDIAKDVRKAGFTPTKNLINYIRQLDGISGISHTVKDICNLYKNDCKGCKPEEKELIHKITQECKKQEMVRAFMPER